MVSSVRSVRAVKEKACSSTVACDTGVPCGTKIAAAVRLGCKTLDVGLSVPVVVGSASRSVVAAAVRSWTGGKAGRDGAVVESSYGSVRPAAFMVIIMGLLKGFLDCTKRPSMVRYELGDKWCG